MKRNLCVVLASLTSLVLAAAAFSSDAGGTETQLGWHGERLPSGLSRGENEGEYFWKKDASVMVYVPAGKFLRGSESGENDERPAREIHLDAFYIDKYEVSWRQWKLSGLEYDAENPHTRYKMPRTPDWGIHDNQPVVSVTWDEANEYGAWVGKQLPTEAQWEKAARGTDGRTYPWGESDPTEDHAIWVDHPIALESNGTVDCCGQGVSPYGAFNMAGNVWEWCQDYYHPKAYEHSGDRNPVQTEGRYRVLRGGAFPFEQEYLRTTARHRLYSNDRGPSIGFRMVVPAP